MGISKSVIMTNLLASPQVANKIQECGGRSRVKICRLLTTTGMSAAELVVLCRLKATDIITSIKWNVDATFTGATGVDIGVYPSGSWAAAETAIAEACLVLNQGLGTATDLLTEILGEGVTTGCDLVTKPLWQAAGVSALPDTGTEYDIVMLVDGDISVAVNLTVVITYQGGD
jgi:hypothetical protein